MKPKVSVCQSCNIPLKRERDYGTNADGSKNREYCIHCYRDGFFTEPDITLQEMIDKAVGILVEEQLMPETKAKNLMSETLSKLKRWKKIINP